MIVRIWVYDGILGSGVAGPVDVFTAANRLGAKGIGTNGKPFRKLTWSVESLDGAPVRSVSGQSIAVDRKIDARLRADAILLTAPFVADMDAFMARREIVEALSKAIRRQHKAGPSWQRIAPGVTCWPRRDCWTAGAPRRTGQGEVLCQALSKVELRADEILTEQDGILSSGAATCYLDLAVRLVDKLAGADLAAATAKTLLIDTNPISQASYATLLEEHGHSDKLVAQAQQRMEDTLSLGFHLPDLAAHLAVSERTVNRRFKQALGIGPLITSTSTQLSGQHLSEVGDQLLVVVVGHF